MIDKIENKVSAWKPLFIGLLIVIFYKIWKILCVKYFNSDEDSFYRLNQMCFTFYRAFATVFGIFLLKKFYFNYKVETSIDRFLLINLFLILPLYFLTRFFLFKFDFYPKAFAFELPFNFFTGAFEEIFFRGLIFIGLAHYLKRFRAMVLSAVLFSLWHYDVISYWPEYVIIFCWGFYAALCFSYGASLLSLTIFHFLWDQIYFGFNWNFISESESGRVAQQSAIAQILLLVFACVFVFLKQKKRPV